MKLLHNIAQNNDFNGFKDALIDDIGIGKYNQIERILDSSEIVVDDIIEWVGDFYGVTVGDIKSKKRMAEMAEARGCCCYLLRRHTPMTLADIGNVLNLDHTTVMHGVDRITIRLSNDQLLISNEDFYMLEGAVRDIIDNMT